MDIRVNNNKDDINISKITPNSKGKSLSHSVSVAFKNIGRYSNVSAKNTLLKNASLSDEQPIEAALRAIG